MRATLVLSCLLVSAPAAAQGRDLGELRITLATRSLPATGVLMVRLDVPPLADADLPAAAVPLHARFAAARAALSAAGVSPTAAQRALVVETRAALVASLAASAATLSRPALLALGMLQHEIAVATATEAHAACLSDPAADCPPDPIVDDTAALATWASVTGEDVYAAYALYQRAESLVDAGRAGEVAPLLVSALAIAALPPVLEATAALLLGTATTIAGAADVSATFGRCATLAVPDVSATCSALAGRALVAFGDDAAALAALGPALAARGRTHDDACAVASIRLARHGRDAAARLPESLGPGERADVLDALAELFEADGHLAWAREALAAAQALVESAARAARIAELDARRATTSETAETWLRRAMAWCLDGVTDRATFTLRLRFATSLPSASVTVGTGSRPVARALGVCLGERAPEPEGRIRGAYSVHVTLTGGS